MVPIKSMMVAALAAMLPAFVAPPELSAQAGGVIEGVVVLEPAAARRSANRYPGGAAESRLVQPLPVVVYLVGAIPGAPAGPPAEAVMSQRDTAFVPAVVTVRAGESVSFPNSDPFFHNVFSYSSAQRFDLGRYPQGESKDVAFPEAGIVEVFCEVHEFMRGAVLIAENPFHAMVGEDNRFRITGVPPGTHTLSFWHPDYGPLRQQVEVRAGGVARVEANLRR